MVPKNEQEFSPFAGVKILDFTRLLPGPWATALAAEHGARVLKVEAPGGGDYSRAAPPLIEGTSLYFESVNRNKRGITIDLKTARGRALAMDLADEADIVVESFRPGTMERLGLSYQAMAERNPKMIFCSLSGFGQNGSHAGAAGHDLNIAGMSGFLMSEDGHPSIPQAQLADFAAASTTVMAMMGGLLERLRTGEGLWMDVSMLESLLSWGTIKHMGILARMSGGSEGRMAVFGENPRYDLYRCGDGAWVSVSLLETKFWKQFCELVNRADLIDTDESEADRLSSHGENGERYRSALEEIFGSRGRSSWLDLLAENAIPCFPVYSPDEVWNDEAVKATGILGRIDSEAGCIRVISSPLKRTGSTPRNEHVQFVRLQDGDALKYFRGAGTE